MLWPHLWTASGRRHERPLTLARAHCNDSGSVMTLHRLHCDHWLTITCKGQELKGLERELGQAQRRGEGDSFTCFLYGLVLIDLCIPLVLHALHTRQISLRTPRLVMMLTPHAPSGSPRRDGWSIIFNPRHVCPWPSRLPCGKTRGWYYCTSRFLPFAASFNMLPSSHVDHHHALMTSHALA